MSFFKPVKSPKMHNLFYDHSVVHGEFKILENSADCTYLVKRHKKIVDEMESIGFLHDPRDKLDELTLEEGEE